MPATGPLLLALTPGLGLLACVLVHVLVSRRFPELGRVHGIAAAFAGGLAVVVALAAAAVHDGVPARDPWGTVAAWLLTYLVLTYCYVIGFFNLGESARRIRLLIELEHAGAHGLSLAEILAAYNARTIVELRTFRLLSGGQITLADGRYTVRPRSVLLLAARALVLLKLLFLNGRSEFTTTR